MLDETSPRNQVTNVPGLYAAGEVDYQYHGANRLGANSLVACLYAGKIGGPAMVRYGREKAAQAARRGGRLRRGEEAVGGRVHAARAASPGPRTRT